MTDYEKAAVAAAFAFGVGVFSGMVLEKYRERKRAYQSVLDDYIKAVSVPGVNDDEYLRFAALQRAGAWRLSSAELRRLADDIRGRGFRDPYSAWVPAFGKEKDFPKCFLVWAKEKNVDLSKPDSALRAIAEDWDAKNIPQPPDGPGMMML